MKKIIILLMTLMLGVIGQSTYAEAKNIVTGTCGENATWTLDKEKKVLTISGTGEVSEKIQFGDIYYHIEKVIVTDGITKLANVDFSGTRVEEVILGNDVIELGDITFNSCYNLKKIQLSDKLQKIGERCFSYCYKLKEVKLPNTVNTISESAFYYCKRLKKINLENIEVIEEYAFSMCPALTDISFGANIKTIKSYAFEDCIYLKNITFNGSPEKLSKNAFRNCLRMKKIVNHSQESILLPTERGNLFWYQDGKKVTEVDAGKSVISKGKRFRITYKGIKGKIQGKMPKYYCYGEDKDLPMKGKRKGYFLFGWMNQHYQWIENVNESEGNLTLHPVWVKYDFVRKSKHKVKLEMDSGKPANVKYSVKLRYSSNKNMKNAKTLFSTYGRTSFMLKKLKKGKKYYFQIRFGDEVYMFTPWSTKFVLKN